MRRKSFVQLFYLCAFVVTTLRPVARVLDENHPILDRESLSQEAE